MNHIAQLLLLSFGASQVSAMAGGRETLDGEFPAFVGIMLPSSDQFCGASIYNRNHVITAANCMLTANHLLWPPNQFSIISGSNTINFNNPRIPVEAIYVHPQYNPFTLENDIAVVRTQIDFNFPQVLPPLIAPVIISTRIAFDTQNCDVVAWNTGNNLQQALTVPIVNRDECNALPLNFGRIFESMLCAGILGTGSGVCVINRGASLYCNNRLEGILSSGFSCGSIANSPGVYTQVRFYLPWIEEQLHRQDIPPSMVSPNERLPEGFF